MQTRNTGRRRERKLEMTSEGARQREREKTGRQLISRESKVQFQFALLNMLTEGQDWGMERNGASGNS